VFSSASVRLGCCVVSDCGFGTAFWPCDTLETYGRLNSHRHGVTLVLLYGAQSAEHHRNRRSHLRIISHGWLRFCPIATRLSPVAVLEQFGSLRCSTNALDTRVGGLCEYMLRYANCVPHGGPSIQHPVLSRNVDWTVPLTCRTAADPASTASHTSR
jgi:hypothetical protein